MKKRKLPAALLASILIGPLLSGCLLTNELGIAPPATISGARARDLLFEAGFWQRVTAGDLLVRMGAASNSELRDKVREATDWGYIAQSVTGLDKNRYYTLTSFVACQNMILFESPIVIAFAAEPKLAAGHTADANQIMAALRDDYLRGCDIQEAGKIVHIGDHVKL